MMKKIYIVSLISLTFLVYLPVLNNKFATDDFTFIVNWEGARSLAQTPNLLKGDFPPGHPGVYRPLATVLLATYQTFWGLNPAGLHFSAVLVHILATILVYFLITEITKKNYLGFVGGLLFGLHPIHVETVASLTASPAALGGVFFFASFLFFLRLPRGFKSPNYIFSVIFATLAYFTNEITFVLPVLLFLYEISLEKLAINKWVSRIKFYLPYFLGMVVYLIARLTFVQVGGFRGDYINGNFFISLLVYFKAVIKYFELLTVPLGQVYNQTLPGGVEAVLYRGYNHTAFANLSWISLDMILSFGLLAGLLVVSLKFFKKIPVLFFGLAWTVIALLPVSTLIPQWSIMHERFTYIASFGVILIITFFVDLLSKTKIKILPLVGIFCILLFWGGLTYFRNIDWKDNLTLWSKDIAVYPATNAYAYFQAGEEYWQLKNADKAIEMYEQAFKANPDFAVAIASAARTYDALGQKDKAIEDYQKAISSDVNFWEGYYNLGQIYAKMGKNDLAQENFQKAAQINPTVSNNLLQFVNQDFSFSYPLGWEVKEGKVHDLRITNGKDDFEINMKLEKIGNLSIDDYLKSQTESFGTLINQGLAEIPNTDKAFVKVFKDGENDKMFFFLFKSDSVIKILVYPANSTQMRTFDAIVGSLKLIDE